MQFFRVASLAVAALLLAVQSTHGVDVQKPVNDTQGLLLALNDGTNAVSSVRILLAPGVYNLSTSTSDIFIGSKGHRDVIIDGQGHAVIQLGRNYTWVYSGSSLQYFNLTIYSQYAPAIPSQPPKGPPPTDPKVLADHPPTSPITPPSGFTYAWQQQPAGMPADPTAIIQTFRADGAVLSANHVTLFLPLDCGAYGGMNHSFSDGTADTFYLAAHAVGTDVLGGNVLAVNITNSDHNGGKTSVVIGEVSCSSGYFSYVQDHGRVDVSESALGESSPRVITLSTALQLFYVLNDPSVPSSYPLSSNLHILLQPGVYNFSDVPSDILFGSSGRARSVVIDGQGQAILVHTSNFTWVYPNCSLTYSNLTIYNQFGINMRTGPPPASAFNASAPTPAPIVPWPAPENFTYAWNFNGGPPDPTAILTTYRAKGAKLAAHNITIFLPFSCLQYRAVRGTFGNGVADTFLLTWHKIGTSILGSEILSFNISNADQSGGFTDVFLDEVSCSPVYFNYTQTHGRSTAFDPAFQPPRIHVASTAEDVFNVVDDKSDSDLAGDANVRIMLNPGIYNFSAIDADMMMGTRGRRRVVIDGQGHAVLAFAHNFTWVYGGSQLIYNNLTIFSQFAAGIPPGPPTGGPPGNAPLPPPGNGPVPPTGDGPTPPTGSGPVPPPGNGPSNGSAAGAAARPPPPPNVAVPAPSGFVYAWDQSKLGGPTDPTGIIQTFRGQGANLKAQNVTLFLPFDCRAWSGVKFTFSDGLADTFLLAWHKNGTNVLGNEVLSINVTNIDVTGGTTSVILDEISCNRTYFDFLNTNGLTAEHSVFATAAPPATAVPVTTSQAATRDLSDGNSHTAAIVAGTVVGAVVVLAAVAVAALVWRRVAKRACDADDCEHGSATFKLPVAGSKASSNKREKSLMPQTSFETQSSQQIMSAAVGGGVVPTSSSSGGGSEQCAAKEQMRAAFDAVAQQISDDRLEITDLIGRGGFGVVYRGVWKGLDVAVKTVNFQLLGGEDVTRGGNVSRVINEAAITFNLSHENIVNTYWHDIQPLYSPSSANGVKASHNTATDWRLILIQEFCNGGTLRAAQTKQMIGDAQHDTKAFSTVLKIVEEVVCGLEKIHEQNIIHGDLNPNNVLLQVACEMNSTAAASKPDVAAAIGDRAFTTKIGDFGLSLKMAEQQTHISFAQHGTPFYIAPEVVKHKRMTKASDIYSLGVIMWEVFHGMTPYYVADHGIKLHSSFPKFQISCPVPYALLAAACMRQKPEERPQVKDVLFVLRLIQTQVEAGAIVIEHGVETSAEQPATDGAMVDAMLVAKQVQFHSAQSVLPRSVVESCNAGDVYSFDGLSEHFHSAATAMFSTDSVFVAPPSNAIVVPTAAPMAAQPAAADSDLKTKEFEPKSTAQIGK